MLLRLLSNLKHLWQTLLVNIIDLFATGKSGIVPKTLLLVHLDAIGDYVVFRNFLGAIRQSSKFQGYRITLCGNQQYCDLAEHLDSDAVDAFIWIDRRKFRYNIFYRFKMVRNIRMLGFAVAIHPASSRIYYWGDSVIRATGATERIGCSGDLTNILPWQKRISDRFYTRLLPVGGAGYFEFYRLRDFFSQILDARLTDVIPCIGRAKLSLTDRFPEPYAVIVPGAGAKFRQWPTDRFAQVARYLHEQFGWHIVLAGSPDERVLTQDIADRLASDWTTDVAGNLPLRDLPGVIAGGRLLVANESSAVHMAVAVGAQFVCVSNGNQLGRFSPYPSDLCSVGAYIYPEEIESSSIPFPEVCKKYEKISELDIDSISVEQVISKINTLIGN